MSFPLKKRKKKHFGRYSKHLTSAPFSDFFTPNL